MVQSERNGAIDAIAQKFKEDNIDRKEGGRNQRCSSLVIFSRNLRPGKPWENPHSCSRWKESSGAFLMLLHTAVDRNLSFYYFTDNHQLGNPVIVQIVVLREEKESIMNALKYLAQYVRSEL